MAIIVEKFYVRPYRPEVIAIPKDAELIGIEGHEKYIGYGIYDSYIAMTVSYNSTSELVIRTFKAVNVSEDKVIIEDGWVRLAEPVKLRTHYNVGQKSNFVLYEI